MLRRTCSWSLLRYDDASLRMCACWVVLSLEQKLGSLVSQDDLDAGRVYPPVPTIHEVTVKIAAHLAEHLYQNKKAWNYPGRARLNSPPSFYSFLFYSKRTARQGSIHPYAIVRYILRIFRACDMEMARGPELRAKRSHNGRPYRARCLNMTSPTKIIFLVSYFVVKRLTFGQRCLSSLISLLYNEQQRLIVITSIPINRFGDQWWPYRFQIVSWMKNSYLLKSINRLTLMSLWKTIK